MRQGKPEKPRKVIAFRLPELLIRALNVAAAQEGRSRNNWVERALENATKARLGGTRTD